MSVRVFHAMAGAPFGGAEAFFVRLIGALARRGVKQGALVRAEPRRIAALTALHVTAEVASFAGPLDFATRRRFARATRDFRPAIVMTWLGRASAACPRGPYVHMGRLGGPYDLKRFRRCDHLIVNTRGLDRWVKGEGWPPERVHVIGNFVDEAPAAPIERSSLATPEGAPVIAALGRLHPSKAFDVLIEALVRLEDVFLWLAGEGPIRGALEDLARRRGVAHRVRFLGWREDTASLIAGADVLACSSRREPLGNVVLEAWARGVPVVAAASEGPAELIDPDRTGVLVPVEDADALCRALARVLGDRRFGRALADAGRATYAAEHGEDVVVARLLALFRKVGG